MNHVITGYTVFLQIYLSLQAAGQMMKLYKMMMEKDATMLEINPMVETLDESGRKKGTH